MARINPTEKVYGHVNFFDFDIWTVGYTEITEIT